jgi:hypothetical protein
LRFFGHFAARAVQSQRKPYHNLLHTVIANDFAEAAHIFIAIHPFQRIEWPRQSGGCIGDRQADARPAIVYAENVGAL